MRSTTIEFVEIFFTKERKKKQPCLSRGKIEDRASDHCIKQNGIKNWFEKKKCYYFSFKNSRNANAPSSRILWEGEKKNFERNLFERDRDKTTSILKLSKLSTNFLSWISPLEFFRGASLSRSTRLKWIFFPPFFWSFVRHLPVLSLGSAWVHVTIRLPAKRNKEVE